MKYILDNDKHNECLFCSISRRENQKNKTTDRKNLILHRGRHCFVVLDGLSDEVLFDLIKVQKNSVDILNKVLNPDGFNMGLNIGKVAGAGMESHMHIHVVPRWTGDTDSMPIISETRVMPEHLKKTYIQLSKVFAKLTPQ
jgi:ATP adenylyltransferase